MSSLLKRREFIRALGMGAASLATQGCAGLVGKSANNRSVSRPNIVLIMADDLGYECLSCQGSASYKTPILDELARTGMRFEHCYAQPLCTPSRVKIMTGRYNFRNYLRFGEFDFREKTFAHVLKAAGYATCVAGKWQLKGRGFNGPYDAGFDEYCLWHMQDADPPIESRYRSPKVIQNGQRLDSLKDKYGSDVFCDYINDFVERHKNEPFFVYYPMVLTHGPFVPTPDSPDWGQDLNDTRYYADMVAYMDKIVGRIVKKLQDLGLRERTLVLFTADNGTPRQITSEMKDASHIKGGKGQTTDFGTHVALIANYKGVTPAGRVCPDLVGFSDFLPTLADAAGAPLPKDVTIDGQSFLPQLRGRKGSPRDWIFCHYDPRTPRPRWKIKRFIRDKRWKLYHTGQLFDVQADPLEANPIPPGQGKEQAAAARIRLQTVLDSINHNLRK